MKYESYWDHQEDQTPTLLEKKEPIGYFGWFDSLNGQFLEGKTCVVVLDIKHSRVYPEGQNRECLGWSMKYVDCIWNEEQVPLKEKISVQTSDLKQEWLRG